MAAGISHRISFVPESSAAPECAGVNGGVAAALSIEAIVRESASALLDARKAIRLLETQARGRLRNPDQDLLGIAADRLTSALDLLRRAGACIPMPAQATPLRARPCLTDRELLILSLVVSGCTNKEISRAVYLGVDSIKASLRQIFTKMGVTSRTAAAVEALKQKLVNSDCEACAWQGGRTR